MGKNLFKWGCQELFLKRCLVFERFLLHKWWLTFIIVLEWWLLMHCIRCEWRTLIHYSVQNWRISWKSSPHASLRMFRCSVKKCCMVSLPNTVQFKESSLKCLCLNSTGIVGTMVFVQGLKVFYLLGPRMPLQLLYLLQLDFALEGKWSNTWFCRSTMHTHSHLVKKITVEWILMWQMKSKHYYLIFNVFPLKFVPTLKFLFLHFYRQKYLAGIFLSIASTVIPPFTPSKSFK